LTNVNHGAYYLFEEGVMGVSASERPMCPTCKHRMALGRISPGERGFEERTFECSTCHRLEKVSLPVDPFKTNAVGWLASELKPPH
jgi:hypothetical protein